MSLGIIIGQITKNFHWSNNKCLQWEVNLHIFCHPRTKKLKANKKGHVSMDTLFNIDQEQFYLNFTFQAFFQSTCNRGRGASKNQVGKSYHSKSNFIYLTLDVLFIGHVPKGFKQNGRNLTLMIDEFRIGRLIAIFVFINFQKKVECT